MASSSVSQESLDTVDYDISARKSKIRSLRAKGALNRSEREEPLERDQNGDEGFGGDHESPSRGGMGRAKDKRTRPSHLHKGKMGLKDKRKLREKRRSTGVVCHLQSTESTGDSLDDEDVAEETSEPKTVTETRKNTSYNESFSAEGRRQRTVNDVARKAALYNERVDDNQPQSPSDRFGGRAVYSVGRNKSPSDLEADLEDNQDYDSTVSHSETNLSVIGKSESTDSNTYSPKTTRPPNSTYSRISPSEVSSTNKPSSPRSTRPWQSPRSNNQQTSPSSDQDSRTTAQSVLSRYPFSTNQNANKDADQSNKPKSFPSVLSRFPQSLHEQENKPQSFTDRDNQKQSYRDSSQSHSYRDPESRPRFNPDADRKRFDTSYRGSASSENQTGSQLSDKFSENLHISNQRRYPRHNFDDTATKLEEERAKFKEERAKLEKKLDEEREENRQLKSLLESREQKIEELEREIYCLNKDLEDLDEDYQKLQVENHALIRTVSQLSTRV